MCKDLEQCMGDHDSMIFVHVSCLPHEDQKFVDYDSYS